MVEPWHRPPIPTVGDASINDTYIGVGRVLSKWEEIELELSHLHSCFLGQPYTVQAIRTYGAGRIFNERIALVRRAADAYFVQVCDQSIEGDFDQLQHRCIGFSARRNDIAHGIVNAMNTVDKVNLATGMVDIYGSEWAVFPPYYDPKRHREDDLGMVEFGYTVDDMMQLIRHLNDLHTDLRAFGEKHFGGFAAPPLIRP
jgi:hypothetical protein